MKLPKESITKLEAASRQLREAIILFFESRDMVAVHTLAAAANQIFSDKAKSIGLDGILRSGNLIRDEHHRTWFQSLNEPQNFFKHADKDPDAVLDFKPTVCQFFLIDSVLLEARLTGASTSASKVYHAWFQLEFPDLFKEDSTGGHIDQTPIPSIDPSELTLFLDIIRAVEAAPAQAGVNS